MEAIKNEKTNQLNIPFGNSKFLQHDDENILYSKPLRSTNTRNTSADFSSRGSATSGISYSGYSSNDNFNPKDSPNTLKDPTGLEERDKKGKYPNSRFKNRKDKQRSRIM
eukprot:UN02005